MEAKLVKEYGNFYLISDKEIQKGDEYVKLDNRPRMLLLGTTIASAKVHKLSLKNCEAIANGYDLDELAEKRFGKSLHHASNRHSFREGFQKALEILGDKNFSEEDMQRAMNWIMTQYFEFHEQPTMGRREHYIQSIQQTEWDVEILEEEPLVAKERQIHGEHVAFKLIKSTVFPNPLFDADGCLILKRI